MASSREPSIANRTDFVVLEETDDYIVVDKPAPLLVHPSKPSPVPTLLGELQNLLAFDLANGARLSIINRLDRETSGVVLVTKNAATAREFSLAMQARKTEKIYLAVVHGWPKELEATVDAPLLRRGELAPSPIWLKRMVHPSGQASLTHFRVLEKRTVSGQPFSLIEAHPVSGRMHQIRVHLSHWGHPIVGDKIYRDESCYLRFIEEGWTDALARKLILPRQALHAHQLTFHLEAGAKQWAAPLPSDLGWAALESPTSDRAAQA